MAVVPFPARNKLAYPAGRTPGIDPTHPAALNLFSSAVISGGGAFVDLESGTVLASQAGSTAPVAGIDAAVGPFSFANAATSFAYGKATATTPATRTVAVIFNYVAKVGVGAYQLLAGYRTNGHGLYIVDDVLDLYQGIDLSSSITLTAGHAYFAAASIVNSTGTPALVNFVARDLTTGAVKTAAVSMAATTSADTGFVIGNESSSSYSNSRIAAAMYSQTYLSPWQLRQWAQDPWAFWYPPQAGMQIATSGVTPPVTTVLYQLMNVG